MEPVGNPVEHAWTTVYDTVGDTPGRTAGTCLTCGFGKGGAVDGRKSLDPVAVLRRIAFLLERRQAETFKVRAFRSAAAALLPLPAEELATRAEHGTLRELRGIGASTERVVLEVLDGRTPAYLEKLEQEAGPLADGGSELRAQLRGDLHLHSDWSDGGSPIEEMAMTAIEVGHEYVCLSDHSPRLTVANGLSPERLARQLEVVAALNVHLGDRLRILTGIEVDILEDGSLDQSEEMLGRLEVVVASVHSKLRMETEAMTRRMVAAVRHPRTRVLGHVTGRLVRGGRSPRPQSTFDAQRVFAACAAAGVAVEINSRPEREDPPDDLIGLALEAGCLFAIDTDAHAPGQLDFLDYGAERAARLGVPAERIVNTWPLERLLAWSAG